MAKGGNYEREISKKLSLWYSNGKHDDLFWRSSQSGGRATVRRRKGKQTRGHCGDICATDNYGSILTKTITIEIKRGYNKATIHDLMDKPDRSKEQQYESWVKQARAAADNANTFFWIIIHKRDKRDEMIFMPYNLYANFLHIGCFNKKTATCSFRMKLDKKLVEVIGMRLDTFLEKVKRDDIKWLFKNTGVKK